MHCTLTTYNCILLTMCANSPILKSHLPKIYFDNIRSYQSIQLDISQITILLRYRSKLDDNLKKGLMISGFNLRVRYFNYKSY